MRLLLTTMLAFSCGVCEADVPVTSVEVIGTWTSEPALAQLGLIQASISFLDGSTYSRKLDFLSFCQIGSIDCEYFWMIDEGTYSAQGAIFTFEIQREKRVVLRGGQTEPEITELTVRPRTYELAVKRDGDHLLVSESAANKATVFRRQVE
jgi:hypothetical protein